MRIRTIKPEFWKSQTLCMLSAETRLLAIALLNLADDEGYFFAHPALIRGELMPFAESHASIPRMLHELAEAEYIRLGEDAQKRTIGLVVNFKKHQRVDKPQRSKIAGTVDFPNWSPTIPVILPELSPSDQGSFLAGMEGNGRGREEEGKGAGNPSPDKPGGTSLDSAESSMPEVKTATSKSDATPSTILPPAKKRKGGGPPPEPEFPDDVTEPYRHAFRQWWSYKRERHEGYKPAGWAALIRQQVKFPPEQVLASVEASMASNWAGLFTHKFADAVNPAVPAWPGKKGSAAAEPNVSMLPSLNDEPEGWGAVWPELYSFPPPRKWSQVPDANRADVRAVLQKRRGGAA